VVGVAVDGARERDGRAGHGNVCRCAVVANVKSVMPQSAGADRGVRDRAAQAGGGGC